MTRPKLPLILLAVVVLAATAWSALELDEAASRARSAQSAALQVRQIAGELESIRPVARQIIWSDRIANLPKIMADAAETVKVFDRMSTRPLEDRALARGSTLQSGQQVVLRDVTMRQAVDFLREVSELHEALRVTEINLEPAAQAAGSADAEKWTLEAAITYLRPGNIGGGS
jgi:hypothetical protein